MEILHSFEIGDKVQPKNINELENLITHLPRKDNFKGRINQAMLEILEENLYVTIKNFDTDTNWERVSWDAHQTNCFIEEDNGKYSWDLRWFKLIENNEYKEIKQKQYFNVGDKVKTISDSYYKLGEVLTIRRVFNNYLYFKGRGRVCLHENQVQPYIDKNINITIKGNQIKAFINQKVGISNCNLTIDSFDEKKGSLIAIMRVLEIDKDKVNKIIDVLFN